MRLARSAVHCSRRAIDSARKGYITAAVLEYGSAMYALGVLDLNPSWMRGHDEAIRRAVDAAKQAVMEALR